VQSLDSSFSVSRSERRCRGQRCGRPPEVARVVTWDASFASRFPVPGSVMPAWSLAGARRLRRDLSLGQGSHDPSLDTPGDRPVPVAKGGHQGDTGLSPSADGSPASGSGQSAAGACPAWRGKSPASGSSAGVRCSATKGSWMMATPLAWNHSRNVRERQASCRCASSGAGRTASPGRRSLRARGAELQSQAIDAVALARGRRAIVEHMTQVATASAAMHSRAHHPQ
jgi:hypothetical protein